MNYYNEWDSFAAEWLKQLIKDGLIPDGEVDSRSIADVRPEDLKGFTQCHFFAGIGGWSRALQLAGWSSDRPVWTGSPPCQSFSTAGKGKGKDDERHLWPVFFNLIRECQPPTIFGEQVASAIRFGWLDDLQRDLEAEGYAAAAVVLPGGAVSAPHKRERLFFVANSHNERHERGSEDGRQAQRGSEHSGSVSMAYSINERSQRWVHRGKDSERESINGYIGRSSSTDSLVYSNSDRPESRNETSETAGHRDSIDSAGFWSDSKIIYCRDGKYRPIPTEPALFPLADGIPNRVGILRGAGNAIVPQAAAEIIKAVM